MKSISIPTLGLISVNCSVVIGNLLVLYVILTCKTLHTTTNRLVLSLTIADLLLGMFILPFAIIQDSAGWSFGSIACKIWISSDIFLSTASIYHLLAISFDRYMAVRQPIKYPIISSTKVVRFMILLVWLFPFLLASGMFTFVNSDFEKKEESNETECKPTTLDDGLRWMSGSISFIIPGIVMIILNIQIFRTVVETSRSMTIKSKNGSLRVHRKQPIIIKESIDPSLSLNKLVRPKKIDDLPPHNIPQSDEKEKDKEKDKDRDKEKETDGEKSDKVLKKSSTIDSPTLRHLISHTVVFGVLEAKKTNIINHITQKRIARRSMRTEMRVARTTGIVVAAFIICWTPFAILYVSDIQVPGIIFTIFFWLGYANSAVNPLLYAIFSRDFRIAFKRLFVSKNKATNF